MSFTERLISFRGAGAPPSRKKGARQTPRQRGHRPIPSPSTKGLPKKDILFFTPGRVELFYVGSIGGGIPICQSPPRHSNVCQWTAPQNFSIGPQGLSLRIPRHWGAFPTSRE